MRRASEPQEKPLVHCLEQAVAVAGQLPDAVLRMLMPAQFAAAMSPCMMRPVTKLAEKTFMVTCDGCVTTRR